MPARTVFNAPILQQATWRYTAILQDETGAPIPPTSLATLTLTVWNQSTGNPIVNGLDHVNILNANRGTLDANGNLTLTLSGPDTDIVVAGSAQENRIILLEWTYGISKIGRHEVQIVIQGVTHL